MVSILIKVIVIIEIIVVLMRVVVIIGLRIVVVIVVVKIIVIVLISIGIKLWSIKINWVSIWISSINILLWLILLILGLELIVLLIILIWINLRIVLNRASKMSSDIMSNGVDSLKRDIISLWHLDEVSIQLVRGTVHFKSLNYFWIDLISRQLDILSSKVVHHQHFKFI